MARPIYSGQRLLIEGEFRYAGVPTDPVVIRCLARAPDGSLAVLVYPDESLTRSDVGRYEAAFTVLIPGVWYFRWEGAGTVDAVDELAVAVQPSSVNQDS